MRIDQPWAEIAARWATRRRLRILAYHGVDQPESFARQMRHVRDWYQPVAAADVVAAFGGERPLPDGAVWVTFDDGLRSVVETGLPILQDLGVPATLFVCPGVIESAEPYWWDVVATAADHGITVPGIPDGAGSPVTALKSVDDATRRKTVTDMVAALGAREIAVPSTHLTAADLQRWHETGNHIGNHTWDHPCLDRCDVAAQRAQIATADRWLHERFDPSPRVFAYPNGDWTDDAEQLLDDLHYDLALLFDHRLAATTQHPYEVSRLRVSSGASDRRFAAILSGAHSVGYHLSRRVRVGAPQDTGLRSTPNGGTLRENGTPGELMPCERLLFDTYVHDGMSVLDLGVGRGRTVPLLARVAATYVGTDHAQSRVDACRQDHPGVDIRLMDASDLHDFADHSFDVVVFSSNGLDYLYPHERRQRGIEEMARVIRATGTVIVSSHNARSLFRPMPSSPEGSIIRRRAVQFDTSVRHVAHAVPSSAFWRGQGYLRESASPCMNYAITPARLAEEFAQHGFELLEAVGGCYPEPTPSWLEPWYYFVFRRHADPDR